MNCTVLLIEPNGALERDLERLMASENCNVIGTTERWLGLYLARHTRPNVIVSSLDLPRLDGYERGMLRNENTRLDWQPICIASKTDNESRQFAAKLRERVGCAIALSSLTGNVVKENCLASSEFDTELKQPA
ncbi:hypothetical protein [Baaleninema sp.]|uniref:hypothetical protein n=1 Tax=Baaleninema sp. TaxID=3101197 RepID=UPI003CFD5BED